MIAGGKCVSLYLQRGTHGEAPPTRRTIHTSTPSPSVVSQAKTTESHKRDSVRTDSLRSSRKHI